MTTEDAIRLELVNLLRYANKTAIASALGVSAQTVINWSEGKHPSQTRLDQVRALYGLPVASQDTKKEAPAEAEAVVDLWMERWAKSKAPDWAQGLTRDILNAVERDRKAFLDQAAAQYAELAVLLSETDSDDAAPPQTPGPKPRRPGPQTGP